MTGFSIDLNVGLKTSYSDFIKSKEFNALIDDKNHLALYLKNHLELEDWIDIENQLTIYSKKEISKDSINGYEQDFSSLSEALKLYLSELNDKNINKKSYSYELLTKISKEDFLILDFNYTRTTKSLLAELGISQTEIDNRVIKVHGSLDEKQIVFGIEDEAQIIPEHVFLRKAYNKDFKEINVNFQLKNLEQLFIFGYSLGETDHMYFKDFFFEISMDHNSDKGIEIFLYHHGEQGYKNIFKQLDNLTRNSLSIFKRNNNFHTIDTSK